MSKLSDKPGYNPQILGRQRSGIPRFKTSLDKWFMRPYLKNIQHKKGPVEWFKW
jgi:hypothetical protein